MKISKLRISNILSFKYEENIDDATEINFEKGINIIIGENGAGKSTIVDVLGFILKRVLFNKVIVDRVLNEPESIPIPERTQVLRVERGMLNGFLLEANWISKDKPQLVRVEMTLDRADHRNLKIIHRNFQKLLSIAGQFSRETIADFDEMGSSLEFNVRIDLPRQSFTVENVSNEKAFAYLKDFLFYQYLINIHNTLYPNNLIKQLTPSYSLLGGYRNYSNISQSVNLSTDSTFQKSQINASEHDKNMRSVEMNEPQIFNLVRIEIANTHKQEMALRGKDAAKKKIDDLEILKKLNDKLSILGLSCRLRLINFDNWAYSFEFVDLTRNMVISDFNHLSSGQKAMVHLIFEVYGRGEISDGLVVVDEPELHLHFQLQLAYLQIIKELINTTKNQFILITHADALIDSKTISKVTRLIRNKAGNSEVHKPSTISTTKKQLINILENRRSTFALFARKVILVEGETDKYFFQSIIEKEFASQLPYIAIININGKKNFRQWKELFGYYGIHVYFIGDFDNVFSLKLANGDTIANRKDESRIRLMLENKKISTLLKPASDTLKNAYLDFESHSSLPDIPDVDYFMKYYSVVKELKKIDTKHLSKEIRSNDASIVAKIEKAYSEDVFILKNGSIEAYTSTEHEVEEMIKFCDRHLQSWIDSNSAEYKELKNILQTIFND